MGKNLPPKVELQNKRTKLRFREDHYHSRDHMKAWKQETGSLDCSLSLVYSTLTTYSKLAWHGLG